MILAGHGVLHAGAEAELLAFAEQIHAPVAWTLLGIGAIDERHPLAYGFMGMHGWKHVNRAIQSADLLVALGHALRRPGHRQRPDVRALRPDRPRRHRPGRDRQERRGRGADRRRREARARDADPDGRGGARRARAPRTSSSSPSGGATPRRTSWHGSGAWRDGLLSADYVVQRIGELTDHEGVYVGDVGQNQMWLARYAGFRHPNTHLSSGGLGTMGYAMPAAMGAALGARTGRSGRSPATAASR